MFAFEHHANHALLAPAHSLPAMLSSCVIRAFAAAHANTKTWRHQGPGPDTR